MSQTFVVIAGNSDARQHLVTSNENSIIEETVFAICNEGRAFGLPTGSCSNPLLGYP